MDPSDPSGGFCTFISSGRVDQNQAITASIGTTRKLILVLHDKVQSLTQPVRVVSIREAHSAWMGWRGPCPVVAYQTLVTPASIQPDPQIIQRDSGLTLVFNPYSAWLGNFHQIFPG
jgi:hypothetical protein